MYYANLLSQYIKTERYGIYNKKLIPIPTPQYVVFYNGTEEYEARVKLRLSDAFINKDDSGDFEWTAVVYNLNTGKNDELLEKCRPLKEYMIFINKVREYSDDKGVDIKTAITNAIDYCIEENIMREFLIKHKAEVFSVCITEFDEKIYEAELREEAREEGRILERIEMYKEENYSDMDIMKKIVLRFGITLQEAQEYLDKYYEETDKNNQ
ncbi:hypothetical protein KQI85_16145 [Falcatimonas sp. MSJ-15]|uniref:hypothetical protein n=1 Tax=Falcatimonas sp. MSJ-15 TaxID=2841515 RepID=UPI001C11D95A|nr:hypothetical protein [Falcatimonas sp. MSJ-15]MBU5471859.1 hypothetical protein [Falcatimonas sp. MSJ-15]